MRNHRTHFASITVMAAAAVVASILLSVAQGPATAAVSRGTSWTVYHGDAAGTGVSTALKAINTNHRAWTSPLLNGEIYGEPLVYAGDVLVATESCRVYALASPNGPVVWSRDLGSPVPSSDLPCGNISPTVGTTGTPVIDPS